MDTIGYFTFITLGVAALSAFQISLITPLLVAVAIVLGYLSGIYEPTGLAILATLYLSVLVLDRGKIHKFTPIAHIVFIAVSVLLAAHKVPGINNYLMIEDAQSSIYATPFDLYLNADKIHIFFALLLLGSSLKSLLPVNRKRTSYVALVILGLAGLQFTILSLGLVKLDISFPHWLPLWAALNLLFTCTAEEAFFRGYIQRYLVNRFSPFYGVLITSVLFGLAHFGGGLLFIVFATLAGLGYGLVFHFSGRLHWAILTHFAFNLAHLLLFTYPLPVQ